MAGADPKSIDLLIVATVTPDMAFPSSGALMADALGMPDAAAYDLSAGSWYTPAREGVRRVGCHRCD